MMPPSTREVMKSVGSKYAVVVGISKKARTMVEEKSLEEEEGRLADMVNHTLEDLIDKKIVIRHAEPVSETKNIEPAGDGETEIDDIESAEADETKKPDAESKN